MLTRWTSSHIVLTFKGPKADGVAGGTCPFLDQAPGMRQNKLIPTVLRHMASHCCKADDYIAAVGFKFSVRDIHSRQLL